METCIIKSHAIAQASIFFPWRMAKLLNIIYENHLLLFARKLYNLAEEITQFPHKSHDNKTARSTMMKGEDSILSGLGYIE